jgi:transcriptional regulator with XRE-family HTH domain
MNNEVRNLFAQLKAERIRQKKSQIDIAEAMGIDRSAVSKMEAGANISIGRTIEFAKILGGKLYVEYGNKDWR